MSRSRCYFWLGENKYQIHSDEWAPILGTIELLLSIDSDECERNFWQNHCSLNNSTIVQWINHLMYLLDEIIDEMIIDTKMSFIENIVMI